MTTAATPDRFRYAGDDATTDFAFNAKFYADADIQARLMTSAGVESTPTYSIINRVSDGNGGYSSATVRMTTAPATGTTLSLYLDPALAQEFDFAAESDVVSALNRYADTAMLKLLRRADLDTRSLRLSDGDDPAALSTLPTKPLRANKYLTFDSAGNPSVSDVLSSTVAIGAEMAAVLSGTQQAAADTLTFTPTGESSAASLSNAINHFNRDNTNLSATCIVATLAISSGNIDAVNDVVTSTAHGRWTGEACLVTGGSGLSTSTVYYLRVGDQAEASKADKLRLYPSIGDAIANTNKINITGTAAFSIKVLRDPIGVAGVTGVYIIRAGDALDGSNGATVRQLAGWVSPRMFGGTTALTDQTAAVMACLNFWRYSYNAAQASYDVDADFEGLVYFCAKSINCTQVRQPYGDLRNGGIYSTAAGKIAFDMLGCNAITVSDFIILGDATLSPSAGLVHGRATSSAPAAANIRLINTVGAGTFTVGGGLVNFASEVSEYVGCHFTNDSRSLTAAAGGIIDNIAIMPSLNSEFVDIPAGTHSNISHTITQCNFRRPAAYTLTLTSISRANPAVASFDPAALTAAGLSNGDTVALDITSADADWAALSGAAQTVASLNNGAGTFALSGLNTAAYTNPFTTNSTGIVRNATGPALKLGGSTGLHMRAGYLLAYGAPALDFDLDNGGTVRAFDAEFQPEKDTPRVALIRAASGKTIWDFRLKPFLVQQTVKTAIVGQSGGGALVFNGCNIEVPSSMSGSGPPVFETPSLVTLRRAALTVPYAAMLPAPSSYANFNGTSNAADRLPTLHTHNAYLTGDVIAAESFTLAGDITPAQITADQNNYNPTGLPTATVARLSSDAVRSLTGLAGGADGRIMALMNVGGFLITLAHESASSTAANRINTGGALLILAPGQAVTLCYDGAAARWRVAGAPLHSFTATDMLLGRATAGAGIGEEIVCTAAGRALLDDASAAAQATTLGLGTGDSPQFAAINVGNASDTTLARVSAGVISVENDPVATMARANVFTAAQTIQIANATPLTLQQDDAGAVLGPTLALFRNSASPAAADQMGGLAFQGKDSGGNTTTYGVLRMDITDPTDTSEDGEFVWTSLVAGASGVRAKLGGGLYHPSATATDKGNNTINFGAVFDDNVLLTDYVFDAYLGVPQTERAYSERVAAKAAALDPAMFDPAAYAAYWTEHRRLWGMPDLNDCIDGMVKEHSLGAMIQLLWQTVELQAIHIENLRRRVEGA